MPSGYPLHHPLRHFVATRVVSLLSLSQAHHGAPRAPLWTQKIKMKNHEIMDLFIKLFDLYSQSKKPLEDFTTELLAGVLQSDAVLLNEFVNECLGIDGKDFKLSTQKSYHNGNKYIIDMVFENEDSICFLENKVNSTENLNQLSTYQKILNEQKYENKYLRYCTKFIDTKDKKKYNNFRQFRWHKLADFLEKKNSTQILVKLFIQFLKHHHMYKEIDFSSREINQLQENIKAINPLQDSIDKCQNILHNISRKFQSNFAKNKSLKNLPIGDFIRLKRVVLYKNNIIQTSEGYTDIAVGFRLQEAELVLSFWFTTKIWCFNELCDFFKIDVGNKENQQFGAYSVENHIENHDGIAIMNTTPMTENGEDMAKWLDTAIDNFKKITVDIKKEYQNINWLFD
jgi:hypothetical protein